MAKTERSGRKMAKRSSPSPASPRQSANRLKRSSDETLVTECQLLEAKARRQRRKLARLVKVTARLQKELQRAKVVVAEGQAKAILELLDRWIFEEHEAANKKLPRGARCPTLSAELALRWAYSSGPAVRHLSLPCECRIIGAFPSDLRLLVHQLYVKRATKVGTHRLFAKICRRVPFLRDKGLLIDRSAPLCELIEQLFDDLAENHFLEKEFV